MKTNRKQSILALIILTLLLTIKITTAQVINYQSTSFAAKTLIEGTNWTNWSEMKDCTNQICLNLDNNYITIETKTGLDVFSINKTRKPYTWGDGDVITSFECTVRNNIECIVSMRKFEKEYLQVYVVYSSYAYFYNVYSFDNK